jgi:3-phosphoglycerate kinase
LAPVAKRLNQLLKRDIVLAKDVVGQDAIKQAQELKAGEVLLYSYDVKLFLLLLLFFYISQ